MDTHVPQKRAAQGRAHNTSVGVSHGAAQTDTRTQRCTLEGGGDVDNAASACEHHQQPALGLHCQVSVWHACACMFIHGRRGPFYAGVRCVCRASALGSMDGVSWLHNVLRFVVCLFSGRGLVSSATSCSAITTDRGAHHDREAPCSSEAPVAVTAPAPARTSDAGIKGVHVCGVGGKC